MNKYPLNRPAFIIASNRIVQPIIIKDHIKNMCLVGFERAGDLWVQEDRIFNSAEEAKSYLDDFKRSRQGERKYASMLH